MTKYMKKNIFTLWNTTYLKQYCNNKTTTIRDAFSKRFTNITRYTTCTTNKLIIIDSLPMQPTTSQQYKQVIKHSKNNFSTNQWGLRLIFKLTQLYTSTQYQHYNTNVETGQHHNHSKSNHKQKYWHTEEIFFTFQLKHQRRLFSYIIRNISHTNMQCYPQNGMCCVLLSTMLLQIYHRQTFSFKTTILVQGCFFYIRVANYDMFAFSGFHISV